MYNTYSSSGPLLQWPSNSIYRMSEIILSLLGLYEITLPLISTDLSHGSLVTPYGDIGLGQHWLRWWLVAWWHQAITWTNVDLSSIMSAGIHLSAISHKIPQSLISEINWNIISLKFHSNFPGANELNDLSVYITQCMYFHPSLWLIHAIWHHGSCSPKWH